MRKLAFVLAFLLFVVGGGKIMAEEINTSGDVSLGLRTVGSEKDSAKFQEYRDLKDGIFGEVNIDAESGAYWLSFTGKNIGYDDESYLLTGGRYGLFKYKLFYDEVIHNYSFGAKTFYGGVGTSKLDYSAPPIPDNNFTLNFSTDVNTWNEFDYYRKIKRYGIEFLLSPKTTPIYANVEYNQWDISGLYPIGVPSGVRRTGATSGSPFGNVVEMPAPIDYLVNNYAAEVGYSNRNYLLAFNVFYSNFGNAKEKLTWRNPYVTNETFYEVNSLYPDNGYYKFTLKGAAKELPFNSHFAFNIGYSRLESEYKLWSEIPYYPIGYTLYTLGLSDSKFDGEIKYKTLSLSLTSNPFGFLTARVYYNYLKKENDSDRIEFIYNATSIAENELFEYKKNNFGFDLALKLPVDNKVRAGYEYLKVERNEVREDARETEDNKLYVEWKNSYLDWLTFKARYERLWRDSDFGLSDAGANKTDPLYIERFVRRFDATDKKMDVFKVGFELEPINYVTLGFEYAYKKNNYDETILGRKYDRTNAFSVDLGFNKPDLAKLNLFFDYENVKYRAKSRYINPSGNYSFDPYDPPTSNSSNWKSELEDKVYAFGANLEVPIIKDRLTFVASYLYEKGDGNVDLSREYGTPPIDISNADDYKLHNLNLKLVYSWSKNISFILGYTYEKLEYSDAGYDGYMYIVPASGIPNTFLTGAYKDREYSANIGYFLVRYRF